jgi:Icc-related predicted phosphoesterase
VRIRLLSDLHDDIEGNAMKALPTVDADVTIVAGDAMAPGNLAIRRVRELMPYARNLIYVPGNHDYYSLFDRKRPELKTYYEQQREELMPRAADENSVILLDDAACEIDDVVFIGSTLWSDLSTCRPPYMSYRDAARSAGRHNDYRLIKTFPGGGKDRMTPDHTVALHKVAVGFIETMLRENEGRDVVVATHMAPVPNSLVGWDPAHPQRFRELDWLYASDLTRLCEGAAAPRLWLHGHIHQNQDYVQGSTRVVANPRGYPSLGGRENPHFDPELVLEFEPRYLTTQHP